MPRLIKAVSLAMALILTFSLCGFAGECGQIRAGAAPAHTGQFR